MQHALTCLSGLYSIFQLTTRLRVVAGETLTLSLSAKKLLPSSAFLFEGDDPHMRFYSS